MCLGVLFFVTVVKWIATPINHRISDNKALLSPILIFAALAISLIYTEDIVLGLDMVFRKNAYILIPVTVFVNQDLFKEKIRDYFEVYLYGLTAAGIVTMILFCIPQETLSVFLEGKDWLRDFTPDQNRLAFGIYSPFMDRLQFGYLLGIGGLIHLWFLMKEKMSLKGIVSFSIVFLTLVLIGARGAQLAFSISAFSIFLLWFFGQAQKSKRWRTLIATGILISFVLVPLILYQYVPAVTKRYNHMLYEMDLYLNHDITQYDYGNFTSVRRIFSWVNTWELIQNNWLFGVGIGDVVSDLEQVYLSKNLTCPANSHNQFLLYWVSAGLLGLIAFLVTISSYFRTLLKKDSGPTQKVAFSFMLFYLVIFLLDVPIWYAIGINGFFPFFCLFIISGKDEVREH